MAVEERPNAVTMRGKPFTLLGRELKPGDTAPDFTLLSAGNAEVTRKDETGKVS